MSTVGDNPPSDHWSALSGSRSTSVDVGPSGIVWPTKQSFSIQRRLRKDADDAEALTCCQELYNHSDDFYPKLTRKELAHSENTYVKDKIEPLLNIPGPVKPDSFVTLHKIVTVGKNAVYYFGTEILSSEPIMMKIFRPRIRIFRNRRAALEKRILSMPDKPKAIPQLHFAFKYQIYKCLVIEPLYNVSLEGKLLYARRFSPEVVRSFMVDMVCAIGFLHRIRIIHRNLTIDSFWIQANRRLKLTDYDYCISKRSPARWNNVFGTKVTNFTAPELFTCRPYTRQTDIWALGVIFYRMTSGRFPFYGSDPNDLRINIQTEQEKYSEFFDLESSLLCSWMLTKDPKKRLGYKVKTEYAFQDHTYFWSIDWDSAHYQTKEGPPICWKFPVARDVKNKVRGDDKNLTLQDIDTFDESKMKMKPLRMDAIRDGGYMFSPEYLEQLYPRKVGSTSGTNTSSGSSQHLNRGSFARRLSMHFHMVQAFRDFEKHIDDNAEDVSGALDHYYKTISKSMDKYKEKRSTSLKKIPEESHVDAVVSQEQESEIP